MDLNVIEYSNRHFFKNKFNTRTHHTILKYYEKNTLNHRF